MDKGTTIDDFMFNLGAKITEHHSPADVVPSMCLAAVKLWAITAQNVPIEKQDEALDNLFMDMREMLAACQSQIAKERGELT